MLANARWGRAAWRLSYGVLLLCTVVLAAGAGGLVEAIRVRSYADAGGAGRGDACARRNA